ncbi:MAG: hypothetical protein JSS32_00665 [Verrucomicrobia bacterium]|nr:hypothetical protein [Verrucomicrobiota bacterium]
MTINFYLNANKPSMSNLYRKSPILPEDMQPKMMYLRSYLDRAVNLITNQRLQTQKPLSLREVIADPDMQWDNQIRSISHSFNQYKSELSTKVPASSIEIEKHIQVAEHNLQLNYALKRLDQLCIDKFQDGGFVSLFKILNEPDEQWNDEIRQLVRDIKESIKNITGETGPNYSDAIQSLLLSHHSKIDQTIISRQCEPFEDLICDAAEIAYDEYSSKGFAPDLIEIFTEPRFLFNDRIKTLVSEFNKKGAQIFGMELWKDWVDDEYIEHPGLKRLSAMIEEINDELELAIEDRFEANANAAPVLENVPIAKVNFDQNDPSLFVTPPDLPPLPSETESEIDESEQSFIRNSVTPTFSISSDSEKSDTASVKSYNSEDEAQFFALTPESQKEVVILAILEISKTPSKEHLSLELNPLIDLYSKTDPGVEDRCDSDFVLYQYLMQ